MRTALSGLSREKWINFLCALSIATGLFLVSIALLFVYNVSIVTERLPERFSVTAFLDDGVSSLTAREIMKKAKGHSAVKAAAYISKDEALMDLKSIMEDSEYILEGLDSNPLPASIEIKLREGSMTSASVKALARELESIEGVDDVQYGEKLLSTIQSVKKHAEALGLAVVGLLCAGIIFVCYATMKILLYRKNDEIETLKLLGATKSFIKSPFIIEGAVIGLAGGAASMALLAALYYFVSTRLTAQFPVLGSLGVPLEIVYYTPLAGLLIGVTGAYIAVGKIKF
jgi:cell division transport system permease protein